MNFLDISVYIDNNYFILRIYKDDEISEIETNLKIELLNEYGHLPLKGIKCLKNKLIISVIGD